MAGVLLPTDCSPAQPSPRGPSAWTPQSTAGATCHLRREQGAGSTCCAQPGGPPPYSPGALPPLAQASPACHVLSQPPALCQPRLSALTSGPCIPEADLLQLQNFPCAF